MYLIPIVCRTVRPGLHQYWLLLERNGTHAMEGSPETAATFAAENGLDPASGPITVPTLDTILLPIRPTPALTDFYVWADVAGQPMREVWRPFLWSPAAGLGGALDIPIGDAGQTVAAVLEAFMRHAPQQA